MVFEEKSEGPSEQHTAIGACRSGTFWLRYGTPCYFDDHDYGDAHSGWVLVR